MLDKRERKTLEEVYLVYENLMAWVLPQLPPTQIADQSAALTRLRILLYGDKHAHQKERTYSKARELSRGPQTDSPPEEGSQERGSSSGSRYTASRR